MGTNKALLLFLNMKEVKEKRITSMLGYIQTSHSTYYIIQKTVD